MRYVCLNCGHRFELEAGTDEKKIRCPSCMRVTGIEKVADAKGAQPSKPWLVPAIAALVLAALGGGYAIWRSSAPEVVGDEIALAPLERSTLVAHLRRLHVDARAVLSLFDVNDDIETFAESATEGRRSAFQMAEGVQEAMRARASSRAFVRWSLGVPRETALGDSRAVLEWIHDDDARRRLYPLEAAVLMTTALRTRGVAAMVAEAWEFPGDRSPPDPSGLFGYYVVAVYESEPGEGEPHIYDPWGGHEVAPEEDDYRVLNDVEVLGAAMNLRAIHLLVRESDAERAMEVSTSALRLAPRSPDARSVRGAILIASGMQAEGVQEFDAARQIKSDAPRRQLMAGVLFAQQDLEGARREISAALEQSPDFAAAHGMLAAMHLAESEPDMAREELERAERLDPDLYTLPGLWAGYYATIGDLPHAVEMARSAVERNPHEVQTRLMAARIYRQAARYDDMRREARAVLEQTPASRRSDMERMIRGLLGATALEDPLEEEADDENWEDDELEDEEAEGEEGGDSQFQLGGGSRLLGGSGGSPSLLDEEESESLRGGGSDEPLLMLGDPSRLRLGGSAAGEGESLHLDMGE